MCDEEEQDCQNQDCSACYAEEQATARHASSEPQPLAEVLSQVADLCERQAQIVQAVQLLSDFCTLTGVAGAPTVKGVEPATGVVPACSPVVSPCPCPPSPRPPPRLIAEAGVSETAVATALQRDHAISLPQLRSCADLLRQGIQACRDEAGWKLVTDGGAGGLTLWYRCF